MVQGRFKSRSFRRVKTKLPGNKTVTHYKPRKNTVAKCASCKTPLKGVKAGTAAQIKRLSKSQKNTNRPYGGNLCSACARAKAKDLARQ